MLDAIADPPEWMDRAACVGLAEFFTPDEKPDPDDMAALTRICQACPVLTSCAGYVVAVPPTWGVWAGRWMSAWSAQQQRPAA